MKKIECIVRPHVLDTLKSDLLAAGIQGLTVYEVRGFGRQKGQLDMYSGAEYVVDLLPKIKVEMVAEDEDVDRIISVIEGSVRSGRIGDGKIFVSPIAQVIRIRTGETGSEAL